MSTISRCASTCISSRLHQEGMGVAVKRSIGTSALKNFDPFLMLDLFQLTPESGFGKHPHRGMSTVTYMFPWSKGGIVHKDFLGNTGVLNAGDVQWMTAGRGIVHSEMPTSKVDDSVGLQLWVSLPATEKLSEPSYQEVANADMPKVCKDGVSATIIAGEALGTKAKIIPRTPIDYIHYTLDPHASVSHPIDPSWNAFIFTLSGSGFIGAEDKLYTDSHTITLDRNGEAVTIKAGDGGFDFVLVAGKPINEPIVQHGPFVMNSVEEIEQAFEDYQQAKNGFEAASSWEKR